jgi:hypothetical protein
MVRDPRKAPCTGDTLIRSDGTLALYVLASDLHNDWVLYRVFAPSTRLSAEYKKALANWREISEAYLEDGAHWQVSTNTDAITERDPRKDPREGDMMLHYKGHGLRVYRTAEWAVFAETVTASGKSKKVAKSLSSWRRVDWVSYTPIRRSSKPVALQDGGKTAGVATTTTTTTTTTTVTKKTCGHTGREPISYVRPELVACLSPNVVTELLTVQTPEEVRATVKATDIAAAENAEARLRKKIRDWPFCPYAGRNVELKILFRDNADGCYAYACWYCPHCHLSGITPQLKLTHRYGEV